MRWLHHKSLKAQPYHGVREKHEPSIGPPNAWAASMSGMVSGARRLFFMDERFDMPRGGAGGFALPSP